MKLLVLLLGGAGLALGQCTGCWPGTQGPCKQTNSVCWSYVGGVCPVGTSPCGNSGTSAPPTITTSPPTQTTPTPRTTLPPGTTPSGFCSTQWSEYSGGNVAKCVPCSSSANCEAGRQCWSVAYCNDNIVCGSAAAVTACPGGTSPSPPPQTTIPPPGTTKRPMTTTPPITPPITTTPPGPTSPPTGSGTADRVFAVLSATSPATILRSQQPDLSWTASKVYKWADFLKASRQMYEIGVGSAKLWLVTTLLTASSMAWST